MGSLFGFWNYRAQYDGKMYIVTGVFWLECAKFRVRFLRCTQGILAPPAGVKTPSSDHTRTPNLLYVDTPVRGVCSVHAHTNMELEHSCINLQIWFNVLDVTICLNFTF